MSITDSTPEVSEISGFLSAVKRRWWVAFLVAALAAGAATLFAQRQATEYTSYATVLVNPLGVEPTKALSSEAVDLEVEAELASSYVVASAAVELLGDMTGVVDDADPARGLRRSIVVSARGDRVLEISFSHPDPATALRVTDGYTEAYLTERLELLTASKDEALQAIDGRREQLVIRLAAVTEDLAEIASEREFAVAKAIQADQPLPVADSRQTALQFEQTQLLSRIADNDQERAEIDSLSSNSGSVIGPPLLPENPTTPAATQIIIAGGVLGFLLGLALIWFLDRTSSRIGSAEELLRRSGIPVVGGVERPLAMADVLHAPATADHAFLATTVLAQAEAIDQSSPLVLAITSVSNGDAAASTALSLSHALSAGRRVLLLSLDLEHDELGLALGYDTVPGVASYLKGQSVSPTNLAPNLDLLPAGRVEDPASLVRSPLLPQLLIDLRERYDVVIATTPGLGTRAEAAALAWLGGSVLLCLDAQRDTRERFARAASLLDELGTPTLGAVKVGQLRRGRARRAKAAGTSHPTPSRARATTGGDVGAGSAAAAPVPASPVPTSPVSTRTVSTNAVPSNGGAFDAAWPPAHDELPPPN